MIVAPINDRRCLGAVTGQIQARVQARDPMFVQLAAQHATTESLREWIRDLPQRDDHGDRRDGPRVEACDPAQRLILPTEEPSAALSAYAPNCFERSALYLGAAELIDPLPERRLATLDFAWGRHTFPVENERPVILDPRATAGDLEYGIAHDQGRTRNAASMMYASAGDLGDAVAIDVHDALDYTLGLGELGAARVRNGPNQAYVARTAIKDLVESGKPPTDPRAVQAISWFFQTAEHFAADYGARALSIVRTTARGIADLLDDVLAQRQRNLALDLKDLPGLATKLATMGVTGTMVDRVLAELAVDGFRVDRSASRALASAMNALAKHA